MPNTIGDPRTGLQIAEATFDARDAIRDWLVCEAVAMYGPGVKAGAVELGTDQAHIQLLIQRRTRQIIRSGETVAYTIKLAE